MDDPTGGLAAAKGPVAVKRVASDAERGIVWCGSGLVAFWSTTTLTNYVVQS